MIVNNKSKIYIKYWFEKNDILSNCEFICQAIYYYHMQTPITYIVFFFYFEFFFIDIWKILKKLQSFLQIHFLVRNENNFSLFNLLIIVSSEKFVEICIYDRYWTYTLGILILKQKPSHQQNRMVNLLHTRIASTRNITHYHIAIIRNIKTH